MLPYISVPFEWASSVSGAAPDDLKLIFSFLISYPFAGILKRVPDARPEYKNLFIIACGTFYLVGLYDLWIGLRTLFISAGVAYGLSYYMRKSPYMPWIAFVFLMGHMAINQLKRQFANTPEIMDITGAQMVMVMKLTAFCWNVADGTLPEEELSDFQKDRRIVELPGFLDYAAYVLFFPGLMVGPSFDFNEYKRWLDTSMFDVPATVDASKKPPTRKKRRIPRSLTPALWKMSGGLFCVAAYVVLEPMYKWNIMLTPQFLGYWFPRRVWFLHLVAITQRLKYYGAWLLAEGACVLCGLGYQGVDPVTGKVSWDRLQNINPWALETAQNSRAYIENWNMNTNKWLRYYMYLRVTPRGKKPGFRASMATFTTSAFWHGFYPGYYLAFVAASFVQTAAKNMRRYVRPFFLDPVTQKPLSTKKYYDAASLLVTQTVFDFVLCPFYILNLDDTLRVWGKLYYSGAIVTALCFAFFASPGRKWLRDTMERRTRAAGVRMVRSISTESITDAGAPRDKAPILGLSQDPEKDMQELVKEVKEEYDRVKAEQAAKNRTAEKPKTS